MWTYGNATSRHGRRTTCTEDLITKTAENESERRWLEAQLRGL